MRGRVFSHGKKGGRGLRRLWLMTKQAFFSFVMVGLVPTICKPLICIDPRHKAEDDDGEVSGLSVV